MFDKVLVSMDLSPATEALVSALPGLRELGTDHLDLVHVVKPDRGPTSEALDQVRELRSRLRGLAEQLEERGFSTTATVTTGAPVVEVVNQVDEKDPDLVLVGSRSYSRIEEAFVGSTAWEIVRRAGRPVLLQRIEPIREDPEAALESRGSGLPERVVHPTDFSEIADRARPCLDGLVEAGVESVTLLHVLSDSPDPTRKRAESRLEELAEELREKGAAEVNVRVRSGEPDEEVLKAGADSADSLVVMGTNGKGFLPGMVLGSVSRQVVRQASARVLLVPSEVR